MALLSRSSQEFDKHGSLKTISSKTRIILSLRFNKPLEEEKSERQKTVNMFDGGNCIMLIKISDCLYEEWKLWPLKVLLEVDA